MLQTLLLIAWSTVANEWPSDLPDSAKLWFKSITSSRGICCDMADGHPTDWSYHDGHYWAYLVETGGKGVWTEIPADAVVLNRGNPTGRAVVWTDHYGGIRCFVPGPEG